MKPLLLVSSIFVITGCSTPPTVQTRPLSVPGSTLPSEKMESVRYAENIKAYPLGRYIDPNNRLVMHEGHVLYRVESTGKWNLHPSAPVRVPLGPVRARSAAKSARPVNDELVAEINRQKELTKTLIQGSAAVSSQLSELASGVKQTQQAVEDNAKTRAALENANRRLDALEEQLRQRSENPPASAKAEDMDW